MQKRFDVIMPIMADDVDVVEKFFDILKEYLPMHQLILIGNSELHIRVSSMSNDSIKYFDEEKLVSYSKVREVISKRTDNNKDAMARTGWYLQQFLKMQYSLICEDEYYLVWDADTVPLRRVHLNQNERPIFHLKREKHMPYFDTMKKLFPEISKQVKESFVAEHMLICTEIMRELIEKIEKNDCIDGTHFYEKILYAVNINEISKSGFSEFETYGNYCMVYHPEKYLLQKWDSLRDGKKYFDYNKFGFKEINWLPKKYDAISFEKKMKPIYGYSVFRHSLIQRLLPFELVRVVVELYHVIVRGARRCIKELRLRIK